MGPAVRRIDRRRRDRRWRALQVIGLSFAIGALTAAALLWRLDARETTDDGRPLTAVEAEIAALEAGLTMPNDAAPAHEPAEVPVAERPGNDVPKATATTGSVRAGDAVRMLRRRNLEVPVEGIDRDDLRDTYSEKRGTRTHEALDIMAPRRTPVLAVEDGRVAKLFTSKAGGLTVYLF